MRTSKNNLKRNLGSWKILMFITIVLLASAANVSSSQLEFKEDLDAPANVIAVADLNEDGKNEVVVGTVKVDDFDYVQIYRYVDRDYDKFWSYKIPDEGKWGGVTSLTVGDCDNDGQKEIIASTGQPSDTRGDSSLRIFDRDNQSLNFKVVYTYKLGQRTNPGSIKVGDADSDGKNEILVGLSSFGRRIMQIEYTDANGYEIGGVDSTGSNVNSVNIADVDNDGKNEVVAGTSCWKGYEVKVIEYSDIFKEYKSVWSDHIGYTVTATGDVDNDGEDEILALSGTHCGNVDMPKPKIHVYESCYTHKDDSAYIEVWNETFETGKGFGQGSCNPVIGDLVGNETNEFAFPMNINKTHKAVYIYGNVDGEFKQLQSIKITPTCLSIEDSDNDGINELLICDNYDREVKAYEIPQKKEEGKSKYIPTTVPQEKDVISSMERLPGFELVIALLGTAIALMARKLR